MSASGEQQPQPRELEARGEAPVEAKPTSRNTQEIREQIAEQQEQ